MPKIRVAVLASGRGSDFQAIVDAIGRGEVNADLVLLLTNNPYARVIERAKKHAIPYAVVDQKEYSSREEHEKAVWAKLDSVKPDLIVLAGYMRVIRNKEFLSAYRGKMINIHPSLLPKYPGAAAQKDAFEAGEKISGYTIHFVDERLDGGQVIWQEEVDISGCKSAEEVAAKILEREHVGLPKIVYLFSKGKIRCLAP